MTAAENRTRDYRFTVVIPVYNEEENIFVLEKKIRLFLQKSIFPTCVVLVNDGSTDNSLNLMKEVCERNDNFFYLSLERNGGLSAALKAGIDYTFSDYLGYMDADLQTDPDDFNLLLPHLNTYDMVIGIRANRIDSFLKIYNQKLPMAFAE
jgi:glycosyltransferase involved in cell wall biosynthesis